MPLWGGTTYPVAVDAYAPQVDLVDTVLAENINSTANAIIAIENKLGITNGLTSGLGGLEFDSAGKAANPGTPGSPTLWIDNTTPDYAIMYTDNLGVSYDLRGSVSYGLNYTCPMGMAVGDLVNITGNDIVGYADAATSLMAHGMCIGISGGGTTAAVVYSGCEISGAWALTAGSVYYTNNAGAWSTSPGVMTQEIGFARNATTLVFQPTLTSYP